ncbi:MAG: methyl-accepting chemotaxis protein, partial [Candidatus Pacearchaeota archaeon]
LDKKNFLKKLFIKTETFVYLVPIPLVLYFGILCLEFTQEKLTWFVISATGGGVVGFIVGLVLRYVQLFPFLDELEQESKSKEKDLELKRKLLEYPSKEGINVAIRWVTGAGIAWLLLAISSNLSLVEMLAFPYIVAIAIPISSSSFYFITESCITELLKESRLANLIDESLFKKTTKLENKMFITILSVTILSSGSIGYLFYFVNAGVIQFKNPILVITIFIFGFIVFIYISNKNLSNSIQVNHQILSSSLEHLAKGKISIRIPIVSKDEYALMGNDLIQVVIALRRSVESLNKITTEITSYSKQMEANSQALINLIQKQSETLNHFILKLDQIKEATNISVNNSKKTSEIMTQTKLIQENLDKDINNLFKYSKESERQGSISLQFIDQGRTNVQENIELMKEIQITTAEIQNIVNAIGEVADQVNLLSLNASIESARAGEYGRGFAVVASEISKLAERVLENSEEIKKISKTVNKNVLQGVNAINATGSLFEEIHNKIIQMKEKIDLINKTVENQTSQNETFKKAFQNSIDMSSEVLNMSSIQTENVQDILNNIQVLNQENVILKNNIQDFYNISQTLLKKLEDIQKQVSFFS